MAAKKKSPDLTYRIDRPPVRVYVPIDELGPAGAKVRLGDAVLDATSEAASFGAARVYEYRLVDRRPRAKVAARSGSVER